MPNNISAKKITLVRFFNATVPPLAWWAVIPAIFVALKHTGVALTTVATSASIIEWLGTFWRVLPEHFKQIQTVTSGVDGNNAGFFYLALVIFSAAAALRILFFYARRQEDVQYGDYDAPIAIFSLPVVVLISFLDGVRDRPDSIFDFYVDGFGFYYFREIIFPYAICTSLAMFTMLVAEIIKESRSPISST